MSIAPGVLAWEPASGTWRTVDRSHVVEVTIGIGALSKVNWDAVNQVSDQARTSSNVIWYSLQRIKQDVLGCAHHAYNNPVRSTGMLSRKEFKSTWYGECDTHVVAGCKRWEFETQ